MSDVKPFIKYFAGNIAVDFPIYFNEYIRVAISSGRGIGLDKGEEVLHPIVVGEYLRRFAGRCILAVVRRSGFGDELSRRLQFGADVKGGADLALHIPRAALEALATARPEKLQQLFPGGKIDVANGFACISADAANAFCSIYVDAVLESICRRCPQLVGFFSTCYHPNGPAQVVLDDHSTVNATSLAQGCCVSSLCCACVVLDILEDIRRDFASADAVGEGSDDGVTTWGHGGSAAPTVSMAGWTLETAYQDDIFSIMPVEIVPLYLASLREHGKSRGLSFDNVAKNLVYVPQQFLP